MLTIFDKKPRNGNGVSAVKYLEFGENNTRDIKDKRITLQGDLQTFQKVTEMGHKKGYAETYRSVVLSFGEDYISEDTMKSIVSDFEKQYMSGYKKSEYTLYAEAHLPKVKTKIDKVTGQVKTRKPHIHILIPTYNIELDKSLTLGNHGQRLKELELWKKVIENKHGLSTVKTQPQKILSSKFYTFENMNKTTRLNTYNQLIKDDIDNIKSIDEIKAKLMLNISDIEYIKESGSKAKTPYLAIKLKSQKQADRLQGGLYSSSSFSESRDEIIENRSKSNSDYYEVGKERETSKEDLEDLKKYYDKRFNFISKSEKYKREKIEAEKYEKIDTNFTEAEKKRILKSTVKTDPNIDKKVDIRNAKSISELERLTSSKTLDEDELKNLPKVKKSNKIRSSETSSIYQKLKERYIMTTQTEVDYQDFKKTLNPKFLFNNLNVDREKYRIWKIKAEKNKGEYRIKCGSRNLNTHDFLTKEINLNWNEAKELMNRANIQQKEFNSKNTKLETVNTFSYQQKVIYSVYEKNINHNLKGFYVVNKKDYVQISSKTKNINIKDDGTTITGTGTNNQEQVKIMLDIAEAKGWNLATIKIDGSKEFKKEAIKQIVKRRETKQEAKNKELNDKKEILEEAKKEHFAEFLNGNEWEKDKSKSTINYPVYKNHKTNEKIFIYKDKKDIYRYQNINDEADKGTINDFLKNRNIKSIDEKIEFLKAPKESIEYSKISKVNFEKEQDKARQNFTKYKKIDSENTYLSQNRNIAFSTYKHYTNLKTDNRNNIVTPLYIYDEELKTYKHIGNGKKFTSYYEKDGKILKDLNEGSKGIGIVNCPNKPKNIVIAENSIDGLSYIEANKLNPKDTMIVSTQGQLSPKNLNDIEKLSNETFKGTNIIIATDNDEKGILYANKIKEKVARAEIDLPIQKDWNEQLKKDKKYDELVKSVKKQADKIRNKSTPTKYKLNSIPTKEGNENTGEGEGKKRSRKSFVR